MRNTDMDHTKHIWRAALILCVLTAVGGTARHFMIPKSFGEEGHYRYDSIDDYMEQKPAHGGVESCAPCHGDQVKAKAKGAHATVQCEVCHRPVASHARNGEKTAEMPTNRSHTLCAYCHQTLRARPETMSQVDIVGHLVDDEIIEPGDEIEEGICMVCHDVHSPPV